MREAHPHKAWRFVGGFAIGALVGAGLGATIASFLNAQRHMLLKGIEEWEFSWQWIWPLALGFGLVFGIGVLLGWHRRIRPL